MKRYIPLFLGLAVMGLFIFGCETIVDQIPDTDVSLSTSDLVMTFSESACQNRCIGPNDPEYIEKTDLQTVQWGNPRNPFTKTVDIICYNTLTHFVLRVKSSHNIADVLMDDESIKNFKGTVPPNTWQEFTFELEKGWEACDTWAFPLQVVGVGPPAYFNVEYDLIGACKPLPLRPVYGKGVQDLDGNDYVSVKIGGQEWMAENLRTTVYRNGDTIPTNLNNFEWENTTSGAYAIYPHSLVDGINSDEEMVYAYGILYNWYAVDDDRGLCPTGWHVPSADEMSQLATYLMKEYGLTNNIDDVNGIGNKLKSCRQINSPLGGNCNTSDHPRWVSYAPHYGTNEFGFSALPGGRRQFNGIFVGLGGIGIWRSSTAYFGHPASFTALLNFQYGNTKFIVIDNNYGLSVRCLKD